MKVYITKEGQDLNQLSIVEKTIPRPDSNQVLIKWKATSLNYHDLLVANGSIPTMAGRIPMSDGAGEIVEIGSDVNYWNVGDRVMSLFFPGWQEGSPVFEKLVGVSGETIDGYMAEYSVLDERHITAIPNEYTFVQAATLPCAGLTAWNGLMNTTTLLPGSKVLIEGTGGMSLLALKIAKSAGAKIIATTSSEEKAERLYDLGVDKVFNYKQDERWGKSIFKYCGGVDLILDVGGGSTMPQSIEASKIGGHICSIGILNNGRKGSITFPKLFFKFITLRGIAVGSKVMQNDMVKSINHTKIEPVIDHRKFSFDDLREAFEYQQSGKQFGKIVIEY